MSTAKYIQPSESMTKSRNIMATSLSIIPGMGHAYKGHYVLGLVLFLMSFVAIWAGLILALATAGLGMIVPGGYVVGIMAHAYLVNDLRKHHIGML